MPHISISLFYHWTTISTHTHIHTHFPNILYKNKHTWDSKDIRYAPTISADHTNQSYSCTSIGQLQRSRARFVANWMSVAKQLHHFVVVSVPVEREARSSPFIIKVETRWGDGLKGLLIRGSIMKITQGGMDGGRGGGERRRMTSHLKSKAR